MVSEERDDMEEIKRIGDNRETDYKGIPVNELHN
jgi:hypothetical protein